MEQSIWVTGKAHVVMQGSGPEEFIAVDALLFPDLNYFFADLVPPDAKFYPYEDGSYLTIGPECFTDGKVISYKGANYYKACDAWVRDLPNGGQSHCVSRVGHPSHLHEDSEGVRRRA